MSLGPAEILVILVLALVVFGPTRLPEVGRQVGGALRELRRVESSVRSELDAAMRLDDEQQRAQRSATAARQAADPASPALPAEDAAEHEPSPAADEPGGEPPTHPGPPGSFR